MSRRYWISSRKIRLKCISWRRWVEVLCIKNLETQMWTLKVQAWKFKKIIERKQDEKSRKKVIMAGTRGFISTIILIIFSQGEWAMHEHFTLYYMNFVFGCRWKSEKWNFSYSFTSSTTTAPHNNLQTLLNHSTFLFFNHEISYI